MTEREHTTDARQHAADAFVSAANHAGQACTCVFRFAIWGAIWLLLATANMMHIFESAVLDRPQARHTAQQEMEA
jgi:hypothetical protein